MIHETTFTGFPFAAVVQYFSPADQGHQSQSLAHEDANEKLGTANFPISCAVSQQKAFERGVALLHSFRYDKAEQQFKDIAAADPTCAIAYWGEAMSQWHQIWDRPDAATMKRQLAVVQKGQKLGAKTPRERDYLDALAVFYQNPSASFEVRVNAYSQAMEKLHEKYPEDHEAAAFYGLSLLAAARRYGQIAPSAPHAAHMPGHIFARLGLWQEDIDANLASIAAAEQSGSTGHELHAMDFLNYAYLQVGGTSRRASWSPRSAAWT